MTTTLSVLEAIVERYGRNTATDPVALAAALRAATTPPHEGDIATLVDVAGSGAVERLRQALERDADAEHAVAAALHGLDGPGRDRARWAVTALGAALGLLPRAMATASTAPTAADDTAARPPRKRRGPLLAAVAGTLLLAAGAAVGLLTVVDRSTDRRAVVAVVPPAPTTSATATPGAAGVPKDPDPAAAPADPRSVFTDPGLLAFAEPYLTAPGTTCKPSEPAVNVRESHACDLTGGRVAYFITMLNTDLMREIRGGYLDGLTATPGTTRSLRWKFAPGSPGARTGIPAARAEQGEGVRIRFVEEDGSPRLYFDQESTGSMALLGLSRPSGDDEADLDALRSYWRNPAGG